MIGVAFCGKDGDAIRVEGTIMKTTCKSCARVPEPSLNRFPDPHVPFTIGRSKVVHAGVLVSALYLNRKLDELASAAERCILDETELQTVVDIITRAQDALDE